MYEDQSERIGMWILGLKGLNVFESPGTFSFLGMLHSMVHVSYLLMNLMLSVQREEAVLMSKKTELLHSF